MKYKASQSTNNKNLRFESSQIQPQTPISCSIYILPMFVVLGVKQANPTTGYSALNAVYPKSHFLSRIMKVLLLF